MDSRFMRHTKIILLLTLIFSVTFGAVYAGEFIHRRDFDRAFFAYYRNPTPENEAQFRVEQRKTELIRIADSAVAATMVTAFSFGLCLVANYFRRRMEPKTN